MRQHITRALVFAVIFGGSQYVMQDGKTLGQLPVSVVIATFIFAAFMAVADRFMEKK